MPTYTFDCLPKSAYLLHTCDQKGNLITDTLRISGVFTEVLNTASFHNSVLTQEWTHAVVTPVHKNGSSIPGG